MYTVKLFIPAIMIHPSESKFRSLPNARSLVKQTVRLCEEKNLPYEIKLFTKQKVYMEVSNNEHEY